MEISRRKFLAAVSSLVAAVSLPVKATTEIGETLSARANLMLEEWTPDLEKKNQVFYPASCFALVLGGIIIDPEKINRWNLHHRIDSVFEPGSPTKIELPGVYTLQVFFHQGVNLPHIKNGSVLFQTVPDLHGISLTFKGFMNHTSSDCIDGFEVYSFEASGKEAFVSCGKN